MEAVPKIRYNYDTIKNLFQMNDDECPRLVILDGPNIMQGTSKEKRNKEEDNCPISSLISLIRILTAHNFEVVVTLPTKYLLHKTSPLEREMLKDLYQHSIVADVPKASLDDRMMLELARVTDGIVLSHDQFRDHLQVQRYEEVIDENSARMDFRRLSEKQQHKMTTDGHYLATHSFVFPAHHHFYSTPTNRHHELSQERRADFTEERRKYIMDLCDQMLLKLREWECSSADADAMEETLHKANTDSLFAEQSGL